jgi:hypothetical protein
MVNALDDLSISGSSWVTERMSSEWVCRKKISEQMLSPFWVIPLSPFWTLSIHPPLTQKCDTRRWSDSLDWKGKQKDKDLNVC